MHNSELLTKLFRKQILKMSIKNFNEIFCPNFPIKGFYGKNFFLIKNFAP